jgi:L-lactate dehydrogenase (cytochrome)
MAFKSVRFIPTILNPVGSVDTSITLFGKKVVFPLVLAPTGFTRMMHHEGEIAVAKIARDNGIPFTLSTLGTTDIAELSESVPGSELWFQLYFTNDVSMNQSLLNSARNCGVETLILTVDCAVGGFRAKDVRNGLTIPPTLSAKSFFNMMKFPRWIFNKLTTPSIKFASLKEFSGTNMEVAKLLFDPDLDFGGLKWLRENWEGKLLVKGILNPDDAQKVLSLGVDGIVVSNHGGRQLDRSPNTLDSLIKIREAVGPEVTLIVDGGIETGQDIIAAIAYGANSAMVGRAYLYGLMAGGQEGVERAIDILRTEFLRGIQLMGINRTSDISLKHVFREG